VPHAIYRWEMIVTAETGGGLVRRAPKPTYAAFDILSLNGPTFVLCRSASAGGAERVSTEKIFGHLRGGRAIGGLR
jgi:hypothetical protein